MTLFFLILEIIRYGCKLTLAQLLITAEMMNSTKVGKSKKNRQQRYKRKPFPTSEDRGDSINHQKHNQKSNHLNHPHKHFFYPFIRPDQTQTQALYSFHRPFRLTPTRTTLRQTSRHFSSFFFFFAYSVFLLIRGQHVAASARRVYYYQHEHEDPSFYFYFEETSYIFYFYF